MATTTTAKKVVKTPAAAKAKPKPKAPLVFAWEGKDKKGKILKGELSGTAMPAVKAQLQKQGINVTKIKKKAAPLFSTAKPIKPADIAIFIRQLAVMMKAGVPLVQSFGLVADGLTNPSMKKMVIEIQDHVSGGGTIASALEKYPMQFDELTVSLIGSGEQAGALESMLDRVALYKEKSEILKAKIKKALTYPTAVVVVALVVTGILLIKVVPVFASTFAGFGAALPAFTQMVLDLSIWVQANWFYVVGIAVTVNVAFGQAKARSQAFADLVDRVVLKLPVIGPIIFNSVIARFARTLSTTFAAGVPLVEALDSVSGAAGNAVYRDAIRRVRDDVTSGITVTQALRTTGVFPVMLLQMCSIGEEAGSLDSMLERVAIHYEMEVDNSVDNLTALLEPLIMSVLGVLVGGLLVAMYLPIFTLGSVI